MISGGATLLAARKIRDKLLVIASHVLEAAADDIVLEDGNAKVSGTDRIVAIAALARAAYYQTHRFKGEITPGLIETAHYDPPGTFSNACHVAIVEVDVETGGVRIEKFLAVEDAGRIINPMIADGQVHGGIAQGIGNALFEEIVYDRLGNIQTATLADYLPPTRGEIPPIELHHIETPGGVIGHRRQGLGRRRRDRRAGGDRQRRQRRAVAVSASRSTKCRRRRSVSARRCGRPVIPEQRPQSSRRSRRPLARGDDRQIEIGAEQRHLDRDDDECCRRRPAERTARPPPSTRRR